MAILGVIILAAGFLLFIAGRVIYKKHEKEAVKYKLNPSNSDKEFLSLVSNGTNVIRFVGMVLMSIGVLMIIVFTSK